MHAQDNGNDDDAVHTQVAGVTARQRFTASVIDLLNGRLGKADDVQCTRDAVGQKIQKTKHPRQMDARHTITLELANDRHAHPIDPPNSGPSERDSI